jgi:hypothetical protein
MTTATVLFTGTHTHEPDARPHEHIAGGFLADPDHYVGVDHTHELGGRAAREFLAELDLEALHRDGMHEPGAHAYDVRPCTLCVAAVKVADQLASMLAGARLAATTRDRLADHTRVVACRFHPDAAELGDRVATAFVLVGLRLDTMSSAAGVDLDVELEQTGGAR